MLASDVRVPCDVSMTSASDMWVQSVRATDMTCGARSMVNIDQSTVNMDWVSNGLWRASGWARSGRTRGKLWRCHVTAMGLYWASSTALAHGAWFMVDAGSRSMDLRQGPWWTESTLLLLGAVHVLRVHSRVAGEGGVPLFLPRRCSYQRRARCEPPWQCWCPIGEGKGFPGPRRS